MASKRKIKNCQEKKSQGPRNLENHITMTKNNPQTINDYLNQKHGEEGTDSRREFTQKSHAYMVAELVKNA